MEFAKVKQEVNSDDSTWDQWEKGVQFDETIKNEDLICQLCSEEVHIKDEFDKNSLNLNTGSEIEVLHSIPTVCNDVFADQRVDTVKKAYIGEEPLKGFQNIPKHYKQNLYLHEICNDYQVMANRNNLVQNTFECYTCRYKSARKRNLVTHMKTHNGELPFACDVCNYKSGRKVDLVRHVRTHTGEHLFACEICKYKTSYKANFDGHMRTHSGERPFACLVCKYKSSQKSNLKSHMRIHTGELPFACKVCKYKSAYKSHLVRHMRTHTDEPGS